MLVVARLMDAETVGALGRRMRMRIALEPRRPGDRSLPESEDGFSVDKARSDLLRASIVIRGLDGMPVCRLSEEGPRSLLTQARRAEQFLLVGVILAWVTFRTESRPVPPPSPPPAVVLPSPPAVENAAKTGDNAAVVAPSGVDNMAVPVLSTKQVAPAPAEPASSVAAVGGTGPLVGPFQLFLEASEQAWVMYSFDDGDPIDVTLYAGDKISIQAKRRITLKLGNAGGVAGTLNGRRLPPFGERGQVRKFAFGQ
jgi:hypothetical protein